MSSRETLLVGDALAHITELLPARWTLSRVPPATADRLRADAVVQLEGPSGTAVRFAVEAKSSTSVTSQVLLPVLRDLRRRTGLPVLFVSDYIGPVLREALAAEDFSYTDATGWVRLVVDNPLVLLTGHGAPKAPKSRASSMITRLNGVAASRTIRTLTSTDLPIGVRDLAAAARVSPGSVSKLLASLTSEGVVERDDAGKVVAVRSRGLIRRWVRDYSFAASNSGAVYFIAPRGLPRTLDRLVGRSGVTLTGSAAARRLLPEGATSVVPMTLLALYSSNPARLARDFGLIDADPATANVVIAAPQDADILSADELAVAPAPLVVADLLTLPGRSDAEAEQLMDTLTMSDNRWKDPDAPRP